MKLEKELIKDFDEFQKLLVNTDREYTTAEIFKLGSMKERDIMEKYGINSYGEFDLYYKEYRNLKK